MRNFIPKILTSAFIIILLNACSDESPFMTRQEAQEWLEATNLERDPFHNIRHVVAIIDNDIYYFNRLDSLPVRLTNTPSVIKKNVKLSFDHSQIAYINASGNPVIVRADNGQILQTLTQYTYVSQMEWAKDRLTLCMLVDDAVYTYGESLSVSQPIVTGIYDHINSYSMNAIGDYGYFHWNSGDELLYYSDSQSLEEDLNYFDGDFYDYIDFYDNQGNFMLGSKGTTGFEKIVCVQDYNFFTAYEWSEELMNTPKFNSEHEVVVYGTLENNEYYIKAVYLGTEAYGDGYYDILNKVLTDYPSSTAISVDWAQY